jgi:hypothetical protein
MDQVLPQLRQSIPWHKQLTLISPVGWRQSPQAKLLASVVPLYSPQILHCSNPGGTCGVSSGFRQTASMALPMSGMLDRRTTNFLRSIMRADCGALIPL